MTSTKSYSVSKKLQLIDINHDMINFRVRFQLSSDKPFYALIVDQETLDNTDMKQIDFHYVQDSLSGEVVSDKNTYQNYYILLKSDEPTDVLVQLFTTPLPDFIKQAEDEEEVRVVEESPAHPHTESSSTTELIPDKYNYFSFKNIIMYIFVISVLFSLYYYFIKGKNAPKESSIRTSLLDRLKDQV